LILNVNNWISNTCKTNEFPHVASILIDKSFLPIGRIFPVSVWRS